MSENNEMKPRENQSSTNQHYLHYSEAKMLPNELLTRIELLTNLIIKDNNKTDCDKTVSGDKTEAEIWLDKARNSYSNESFVDAEHYLLQAEELFQNGDTKKNDEVSLDRSVNNLDESPNSEKERLKRNILLMRSEILSMQVKVSAGRIQTLNSLEGIVDTTCDTENYRVTAEKAISSGKCDEADANLLEAERLYQEMADKLFPAKPKNGQNRTDEYFHVRKPITGSNRPGVTVRGDNADVRACLEKARIAFDANELEKAKKWLEKSERMMPTVNARELLNEVLAAIAARDAQREEPNVEPEVGFSTDAGSTPSNSPKNLNLLNKDEAETYLQIANNAMEDDNLDRAEQFLLKSEKLYPLDDAKELRIKLQAAKDSKKSKGQIDSKKKTSKLYVEIALNSLLEKELEKALVFAKAANNLDQSDTNKSLLADISKEIVKNKENLNKKNEEEAKECLRFAQSESIDGCAANAELFCLRAQDLYPTKEGEELLRKFNKQSSFWNGLCFIL